MFHFFPKQVYEKGKKNSIKSFYILSKIKTIAKPITYRFSTMLTKHIKKLSYARTYML
jgi:hypothetical protein